MTFPVRFAGQRSASGLPELSNGTIGTQDSPSSAAVAGRYPVAGPGSGWGSGCRGAPIARQNASMLSTETTVPTSSTYSPSVRPSARVRSYHARVSRLASLTMR